MAKELLISSTSLETKLAIVEDDQVTEIFIERTKDRGILGNIYKGKVTRVLPGMQAAFVNIGLGRDAFLYVTDFFEDYEEYEALFSEEGQYESVFRQESGGFTDERRRSRRNRHVRREGIREVAEERQIASSPAARDALEEIGQILPESLDISGALSAEFVSSEPGSHPHEDRGSEEGGGTGILPAHLETLVEFKPQEPGAEELPDEEAGLEDRFDTHQLALPSRSRKRRDQDRTSIGDLLREGQEILVQIAKEPIGKKGSRITSHVALPGRYVVFMPTVEHVGVSRKISSAKERERLREMIVRLRGNSGKGFIVRTVGENKQEEDFRRDMIYLTGLWEDVRSKAEKMSGPALIYSEPYLVQRVIRDYFSGEYRAIRVDDEQEYERVVNFVNRFNPELVNRVRLYNKSTPLFDEYGVTAEVARALRPKIWLKTGGYIVINQTEALVAIDVNTGKFVGKTNSLEDTITRTNLDAVKELVRQIRLRDLGGIIVIDFIDMDERKNRQKVMEALQNELAKDKSPSRILQFNEFGLVAITRKRVKQSLEKVLYQPCTSCDGSGMTKSVRTVCYSIYDEIRRMLPHIKEGQEILIRCHPQVGKALRDRESEVIKEIEDMTGKVVSIKTDPLMHIEQFDLVES